MSVMALSISIKLDGVPLWPTPLVRRIETATQCSIFDADYPVGDTDDQVDIIIGIPGPSIKAVAARIFGGPSRLLTSGWGSASDAAKPLVDDGGCFVAIMNNTAGDIGILAVERTFTGPIGVQGAMWLS